MRIAIVLTLAVALAIPLVGCAGAEGEASEPPAAEEGRSQQNLPTLSQQSLPRLRPQRSKNPNRSPDSGTARTHSVTTYGPEPIAQTAKSSATGQGSPGSAAS
jgi:hypothetical protein